jgi:hypothetical protein
VNPCLLSFPDYRAHHRRDPTARQPGMDDHNCEFANHTEKTYYAWSKLAIILIFPRRAFETNAIPQSVGPVW